MQLFDDLLERLRLDSTVFCRMSLAGDWGFTKAALQGAPFHIVLSGRAFVELAGERGWGVEAAREHFERVAEPILGRDAKRTRLEELVAEHGIARSDVLARLHRLADADAHARERARERRALLDAMQI